MNNEEWNRSEEVRGGKRYWILDFGYWMCGS
jgi:hypothetical protein